ncbi:MAG: 16S rRNA (adenine(1518)-N(6)/adenine(1519)-N(6))-dimethyltransferase RsmA [Planctomycetota bacterium]|nr:16S rRNA (adenine(1518)-N(6)/adenine(1519)-N(6))-dimethyltransferase RsmA [Planctomycetota bacterium]
MRRPPWSEFKAALDAVGFRPSKRLGQNFLLDGNMARSIARDAEVERGDFVLEVGAGCGFLTVHLAELGARLLAVEVDRRLFEVARGFLAPFENVRLLRADVLAGKHALAPELLAELPEEGDWHMVANLPYAIVGPLFVLLARSGNPPRSMTALVQRELAEKIVAVPGSRDWGVLGARLAPVYERRGGRSVAAGLFWPRPRVESRVVHLLRREDRPVEPGQLGAYDRLVEGLFQRRRKSVRATLTALLGGREAALGLLERAGVDPDARPEGLSAEDLSRLAGDPVWRG